MVVRIELVENGKMPTQSTSGAVGYDCYAREIILHHIYDDTYLPVTGATVKLGFKIDCNIPYNEYHDVINGNWLNMNFAAFLFPRSGWGTKYGVRLKNTTGVIDPDYRGEVIAELTFDVCPPELQEFAVAQGKLYFPQINPPRVCQMVFLPCYVGKLTQVESLDETERGDGGFGSTGNV